MADDPTEIGTDLAPRVSKLEAQMATVVSTVESLATSVKESREETLDHFERIHTKLDRHSEKSQVTAGAVTGIIAVAISLISLVAGFVFLVTSPIGDQASYNYEAIANRRIELTEDYYNWGKQAGKAENYEKVLSELVKQGFQMAERVSAMESSIEANKSKLYEIDIYGSRKWVDQYQEIPAR